MHEIQSSASKPDIFVRLQSEKALWTISSYSWYIGGAGLFKEKGGATNSRVNAVV